MAIGRPWLPVFILVLVLCPFVASAQKFTDLDDFLLEYEAAPPELKSDIARNFIEWRQGRGGFPIRDADGHVVFVYIETGDEQDVRLTGDFRASSFFNVYWDKIGEPMSRVGSVESFPRGTLHRVEETWAVPNVTVYLPPGYDASRTYPAVYTADGTAWWI